MNRALILQTICIGFTLLFITTFKLHAQAESKSPLQECQQLIDNGTDAIQTNNFSLALELLTKAEVIAEKNQWRDKLYDINYRLGRLHSDFANFGESLGYYLKALTFAKGLKDTDIKTLNILNNIGILYSREKEYKGALEYYKKVLVKAQEIKADYYVIMASVNIADIYNKVGNYKAAKKYLQDINQIQKTKKFELISKINYAESELLEGNTVEAQKIMERLLDNVDRLNDKEDCYLCVVELLSRIYSKQNKVDLAIVYANKGLQDAHSADEKVNLYQHLSELYFKKKEYEVFKAYKDSVELAKDSVAKSINRGLYESNKAKLKVQEFQNEAKSYKDKQEAERKIFIISIIFSIIVFLLIYRTLKNRITKQKQEKVIAENQQKIISLELEKRNLELEKRNNENLLLEQQMREKETNALLEQERLINEIDKRNRQLSAKALNLSGRNQLIEEVINSFYQNPKISSDPVLLKHINDLKTNLKTDEWDSFILHFEEVNNNMLKRLQALYPSLTPHDLRFIAYLYMNLSYKEIAIIFNITAAACSKRRERIMAKMDVPKDVSLHAFISAF
jgi:DNA-binding CsgD family transcriptional regulator